LPDALVRCLFRLYWGQVWYLGIFVAKYSVCLYAKNSLIRSLLAFFVREIEHISFASLAHILERDISILTQLTSRFEFKIHNNPAAAKSVEDTRRWLQDAKQEG